MICSNPCPTEVTMTPHHEPHFVPAQDSEAVQAAVLAAHSSSRHFADRFRAALRRVSRSDRGRQRTNSSTAGLGWIASCNEALPIFLHYRRCSGALHRSPRVVCSSRRWPSMRPRALPPTPYHGEQREPLSPYVIPPLERVKARFADFTFVRSSSTTRVTFVAISHAG